MFLTESHPSGKCTTHRGPAFAIRNDSVREELLEALLEALLKVLLEALLEAMLEALLEPSS